MRDAVTKAGLPNAIVQEFEGGLNDFSIRIKADQGEKTGDKIVDALKTIEGIEVELKKKDFVGPVIGDPN